jgi:hypothetical protein
VLNISIKTLPHSAQRYDTCGDYKRGAKKTKVRVSELSDWRFEALVAVHELVELLLCEDRGVSDEQIDAFDFAFQGKGEPGDDPSCPYYEQHQFAEKIEFLLASELGVNWTRYEDEVSRLSKTE